MRKWELWENREEGSSSFFPESNTLARVMAMEEGQIKTWEVEAASHNDAMRAMNEHLDYGPYVPMLRDDGTPYPEDEDDEIRREKEGELFDTWIGWCPNARTLMTVPCDLEAEEILRLGGLDWTCSACGHTFHAVRHRRAEGRLSP